jgi:hypothetical protein
MKKQIKLYSIIYQNLNEASRMTKELVGNIQPAIQDAIDTYRQQLAQVSAASQKDFGVNILTPIDGFSVVDQLKKANKAKEANAFQAFLQTYKNAYFISLQRAAQKPLNSLQTLVKNILSNVTQAAKGKEDPLATHGSSLKARAQQGDIQAKINNTSEEGKQLLAKLKSLRGDNEKKAYILSSEFKQLIQKVDPKFFTQVKGLLKVNPEIVADIGGFRIYAKELANLNESSYRFLILESDSLSDFISLPRELEDTFNYFINHFENNRVGDSTVAALKQLIATYRKIDQDFKQINVPEWASANWKNVAAEINKSK